MLETTNNRMELLAAITALEALPHRHRVVLYLDSAYVCDCFAFGWWRSGGERVADPLQEVSGEP